MGRKPSTSAPSREELYELYTIRRLPGHEIAAILNRTQSSIYHYLRRYEIPRRDRSTWSKPSTNPGRESLNKLYHEQGLATSVIAQRLGVSPSTVNNWLKKHCISPRPCGNSSVKHGITPPTAQELKAMVEDEQLFVIDIAQRYDCATSSVRKWFSKLGLKDIQPPRYSPMPPKAELEHLYLERELNTTQLANHFGVSQATSSEWLAKRGVNTRVAGAYGGMPLDCADGHQVRSSYERTVCDFLASMDIDHDYEPSLPFSPRKRADFYANGFYVEIWGLERRQDYQEKMKIKRALYHKHKAPLIELFPRDFGTHPEWRDKLEPILSRLL